MTWMVIGGVVLVVLVIIGMYNSLIAKRNAVENAMGGLDAQLKMRFDLIPNLIKTVKVYMKHEADTLERLTELRAKALSGSAEDRVAAANEVGRAMHGILVAAENYPDLKASQNFVQLQGSLNEVEDRLSASRRTCNAAITELNNAVEMFPGNLIAARMGLNRRPVLEIPEAERANVDVGQLFQS